MDDIFYALETGGAFAFVLILWFTLRLHGTRFLEEPHEYPVNSALLLVFLPAFILNVIRFSSLPAFLVLGLGVILLGVCLFLFAGKVASHPPVKAKSEKPYLDVGAEIQTLIRAYDEKISQLSISEGEEREHQQAALRKLRPYGKNAVKPLLELLTNRTYRFSKASHALAYTALEEIDPVALYIHILTYSKKPDARRKAAKRLGDIADKKALQALKQHLNDDDQAVRKIATDTIAFYSAVGEI